MGRSEYCKILKKKKTANEDQRVLEKNNKLAEIIFLIHIASTMYDVGQYNVSQGHCQWQKKKCIYFFRTRLAPENKER